MKAARQVVAVLAFLAVAGVACTDGQAKVKPNYVFKDAPRAGVLAKVAGQEITEEDLVGGELRMEYIEAKRKEYDILMEGLNRAIVDRLVGAEAKQANTSTEEFIDKKIIKGAIKVSDGEIKKFLADRRFPEAQATPEIKGRVTEFLQAQKRKDLVTAYAANLTKKAPVEVYFKKHKMKVDVAVGDSASWGSEKAPVTIVEFSDFQCPFCAQGANTVTDLKKKYGESKIRIVFKHLPLPNHPAARPAAEASLCVKEQGDAKFWKFHDIVFKNQATLNNPSENKALGANASLETALAMFAKDAGADAKKFGECVAGRKYVAAVEADLAYAEKLGVRSTPTFFVNGQILAGALPLPEFSALIDDEIEEAKK